MKLREIVLAGTAGLAGAVLRFLYIFFPLSNLVDVLVFGLAGYGLGRSRPANTWMTFLLLVLPALLFIGRVVTNLGLERLRHGIGIGHIYAALLIPVASGVGLFLASRSRASTAASA